MEEIWKDIPGYEGHYQVSNLGEVRSLKFNKVKILKGVINNKGYAKIRLSINNRCEVFALHQLVAIAFLNHKRDGMRLIVDHIDNNKLNNIVTNLQIVTNRQNIIKDFKPRYQKRCQKTGRFISQLQP